MRSLSVLVLSALVALSSCSKEKSIDTTDGTGNPGSGGVNGNCNDIVQKIKRIQFTAESDSYVEATWNTDGSINSIKINEPLTEYRTINMIYSGGKIVEGELLFNETGDVYDTVVFRYDAAGRVDSMHLKNDDGFGIRLRYNNDKLVKLERYNTPTEIYFYWDLQTDAGNNITGGEEYWYDGSAFKKESTYTYKRDDRKNPFKDLAPYMFYLDDAYGIFRYWGNNNYTDQRWQDHTGLGADITSGLKYTYNTNCYPESSLMTVLGFPVFTDPDYLYTYY
ncbi:hypothetical protein [Pseudobacter ginsenosidimutans]|uniref:YD repeat-containing protein n=1 Tax=Pseudobacter ginsenosidimutans TaxID=661488 RepID=A0A4V2EZ77_9BACT|nr:hypothetical protein [Pseudobacter ginsenosidimutans]QEC45260.1 hypothetical protein FSB84_27530 [Pseudobacter ginsenosidimutans]RZS65530.1 hypothetical protein EV199_5704 [Pseudobacter ginsenosidimutans]